jgi:hypothetical protein
LIAGGKSGSNFSSTKATPSTVSSVKSHGGEPDIFAFHFTPTISLLTEMMKIASGKEERPPELDTFAAAFAVAGEDQEKATDE